MSKLKHDEIGYWSEIKLEIVSKYASAYSKILSSQPVIRRHLYIDAFAGAGVHISKKTGEFISGSPMNALLVEPPFSELHFIDLNGSRTAELRKMTSDRPEVRVHEGDCNQILVKDIFPRCQYKDYCRALCLLDPYGLHLDWTVISTAGQMNTIDIFLNFLVMDMNMNILWHDIAKVPAEQIRRMNAFWGDESWRKATYSSDQDLFGHLEKTDNKTVAEAFRMRLKKVAGFKFVPSPMPMRNTKGAVVYYLFFASPDKTGNKIVEDIFNTYATRGMR